jgi:peptide/nickel transport system substrate-binding protein
MRDIGSDTISRRQLLVGGAGAAAGMVLAACGSSSTPAASTTTASGAAKRGGRLRIALEGGGEAETLNPINAIVDIDSMRANSLFDNFVAPAPDASAQMALAESFHHNADASVWTIRLRDGVEFHDGKPLTADDAIYSLRYAGRADSPSSSAITVQEIDLKGLKKLDRLTFRAPLVKPIADLPNWLLVNALFVVKEGTTNFEVPVGTGPFKFVSWTKGQSSLFARNPNYWDHPKPYVDELVLESLPDATTRLNALLAGQVDAIHDLDFSSAKQYQSGTGAVRLLYAKTPGMVPMTMAVDVPPFNDVRVRTAMRLIANRPALVDDVTAGFGQVGNDVYGKGVRFYNDTLPQRQQDIEQAKSLLKSAGHSGLTVQLNSSTAASGMLESATVFAQQAAQAGVKVNLKQYPADSYFDPPYLKWGFGQDYFQAMSIANYTSLVLLSDSPYNETHWRSPSFDKLFYEALGDTNDSTSQEKWFELQKIQYEQGGFLIWGTTAWVDGLSPKVKGAVPNAFYGLSAYRADGWWLA